MKLLRVTPTLPAALPLSLCQFPGCPFLFRLGAIPILLAIPPGECQKCHRPKLAQSCRFRAHPQEIWMNLFLYPQLLLEIPMKCLQATRQRQQGRGPTFLQIPMCRQLTLWIRRSMRLLRAVSTVPRTLLLPVCQLPAGPSPFLIRLAVPQCECQICHRPELAQSCRFGTHSQEIWSSLFLYP